MILSNVVISYQDTIKDLQKQVEELRTENTLLLQKIRKENNSIYAFAGSRIRFNQLESDAQQ